MVSARAAVPGNQVATDQSKFRLGLVPLHRWRLMRDDAREGMEGQRDLRLVPGRSVKGGCPPLLSRKESAFPVPNWLVSGRCIKGGCPRCSLGVNRLFPSQIALCRGGALRVLPSLLFRTESAVPVANCLVSGQGIKSVACWACGRVFVVARGSVAALSKVGHRRCGDCGKLQQKRQCFRGAVNDADIFIQKRKACRAVGCMASIGAWENN